MPTQRVKILILGELSFDYSQKLRAKLPTDQYHITATSADSEEEIKQSSRKEGFRLPQSDPKQAFIVKFEVRGEGYDYQTIISNPRVDFLEPPLSSEIAQAEAILGYSFPSLVRQWIRDFGSLQICPDAENDPKLLLLGLSPESSIDDDIVLFNDSDNPSLPAGYFVFAHEFDGESDIVYARRPDSTVVSVKNQFAFPYFRHKDCYARARWKAAFKSVEQFWERKVELYLTW